MKMTWGKNLFAELNNNILSFVSESQVITNIIIITIAIASHSTSQRNEI